jgi:hypothetical protein
VYEFYSSLAEKVPELASSAVVQYQVGLTGAFRSAAREEFGRQVYIYIYIYIKYMKYLYTNCLIYDEVILMLMFNIYIICKQHVLKQHVLKTL